MLDTVPEDAVFIRSADVCKLLNISNSTLRNLRAERAIPFYKLGGTFLYSKEEIMNYLASNYSRKNMSKNGFSYYKAETDRFQDIKIKRLKKKYGCDGYAVYQYALNEIYRVDGSYIRWTEDQLFDCADYWGMNEERVKEIVDYCAEICLFDPVVWKMKCILTSRAIQTRYIDICKLAKKKMYIPLDILLVEPEQPIKEPVTMPLFEAATAAEPTGQIRHRTKTPDVSMSPTTVELDFRESSGRFPELSGNFWKPSGKNRQRKKSKKEKKKTKKVLLYPPTDYPRRTHGGGSESFTFFHSVGEK